MHLIINVNKWAKLDYQLVWYSAIKASFVGCRRSLRIGWKWYNYYCCYVLFIVIITKDLFSNWKYSEPVFYNLMTRITSNKSSEDLCAKYLTWLAYDTKESTSKVKIRVVNQSLLTLYNSQRHSLLGNVIFCLACSGYFLPGANLNIVVQ